MASLDKEHELEVRQTAMDEMLKTLSVDMKDIKQELAGMRKDLQQWQLDAHKTVADLALAYERGMSHVRAEQKDDISKVREDYGSRCDTVEKQLSVVELKSGFAGSLAGAATVIIYAVVNALFF